MTQEELDKRFFSATAVVKLVCGVGNNAAWLVTLDAMDHARKCRRFRGSAKQAFNRVVKMFHKYENNLIYATNNRMFNVDDIPPEIRRKYGDITNREYYDFWASMGGMAYHKTRPMITSLCNKYRLSLVRHGAEDAGHLAWVMTATACTDLAVQLYEKSIRDVVRDQHLPENILRHVFRQLSLEDILKKWMEAQALLAPDTDFPLESGEIRNIDLGLEQLAEAWLDVNTLYDSAKGSVEDYSEVFRSKRAHRMALANIEQVKAEVQGML